MTAKRFTLAYADYDWWAICDKENPTELGISGEDVVRLLNEQDEKNIELSTKCSQLEKENKQLKKEKEKWKSSCSLAINENSILWNEISILREQGAEPSKAFNDYLNKKRGDLNDCETNN